jgi:hypothetical protein
MRARLVLLADVVLIATVLAPPAMAQETATATMNVTVSTMAKLTVSTATLTCPDANPDLSPQVAALQGALSISAKARSTDGSQVVLTIQAADDLRSGLQVIPASAISWTVTGAGFAPGTLSKASPVTLGQWSGSGSRSGTQTLLFQNLWTYATGTYTCTLTYTLTGP